jgi:hypothetical protein
MINLQEVKALLQINDNTRDSLINSLIPKTEDSIIKHCRNHFLHEDFNYIMSTSISFDSSENKIEMTNIENYALSANNYIRIYGSLMNDGVYLIDEVGTGYLKINSLRTLKDEDLSRSIVICLVIYPEDLKIPMSQAIGYRLENFTPGVKNESIDDYSYTLADSKMVNGLPSMILGDLIDYKHVYLYDFFKVYNVCRWW